MVQNCEYSNQWFKGKQNAQYIIFFCQTDSFPEAYSMLGLIGNTVQNIWFVPGLK